MSSGRGIAAMTRAEIRLFRREPFSLVFLDPPHRMKLAEKSRAALRDGGWLTPGALLVVEEHKAAAFVAPEGFEELERRQYDDTEFTFLRFG